MAELCPYRTAAMADGWTIGPQGKWWRPANDDGSRYCDTPRAFRYICEDHGLAVIAKAESRAAAPAGDPIPDVYEAAARSAGREHGGDGDRIKG